MPQRAATDEIARNVQQAATGSPRVMDPMSPRPRTATSIKRPVGDAFCRLASPRFLVTT